ncbi:MAG: hypothetical protein AAF990_17990 [Bacteroidota bacterium]
MKTPKDNIFRLISAMTAAEKRYFKRHYSSDKNLLTELFDFINGMTSYREEAIKEHFSDSKLAKNLKVYKVQLSDLLLKSLASYHSKKTVQSKIRIGLEEADILFKKELFDLAEAKLQRAKDLCLKTGANAQLLEVYCLESKYKKLLNPFCNRQSLLNELEEIAQLNNRYLVWQNQLEKLNQFKNSLFPLQLSSHQREYCQHLLANMPDSKAEGQSGFYTLFYHYRIKGTVHFYLDNTIEGQQQFESLLRLFEEFSSTKERHPGHYLASVYDYLYFLIEFRRYRRAGEIIDYLQAYFEEHPELSRSKLFLYLLMVNLCLRQGNFEDFSEPHIQEVVNHIQHYQLQKHPDTISIYLRLAVISLMCNNPQRAHYFFRRIQLQKNQLPKSLSIASDLMEMVSHYETKDIFLIKNWLHTYRRKQPEQTDGNGQDFQAAFIDFLTELTKTSKLQHAGLATQFLGQIDQYKNDPIYLVMSALMLEEWLSALKENTPLSDRVEKIKARMYAETDFLYCW